ncbi:hypothetical protein CTAYLR_010377, partial [Chrysophaeum taylorii]
PYAWHHFCITFDGEDVAVYADGAILATYSPPQALNTGPHQDLIIGHIVDGDPTSAFLGWVGAIDDVMVFNKALSATSIDETYPNSDTKSEAVCVADCQSLDASNDDSVVSTDEPSYLDTVATARPDPDLKSHEPTLGKSQRNAVVASLGRSEREPEHLATFDAYFRADGLPDREALDHSQLSAVVRAEFGPDGSSIVASDRRFVFDAHRAVLCAFACTHAATIPEQSDVPSLETAYGLSNGMPFRRAACGAFHRALRAALGKTKSPPHHVSFERAELFATQHGPKPSNPVVCTVDGTFVFARGDTLDYSERYSNGKAERRAVGASVRPFVGNARGLACRDTDIPALAPTGEMSERGAIERTFVRTNGDTFSDAIKQILAVSIHHTRCNTDANTKRGSYATTFARALSTSLQCAIWCYGRTTHFDAKHEPYVITELDAVTISKRRTKHSAIARAFIYSVGKTVHAADIGSIQHSYPDICALVRAHESAKRDPVSNSDCVTNGCANNSTLAITIGSAYGCPYKCTDHFPDATTHFDAKHDTYVIAELVAIGISERRTKRSTIASVIACSVGWPHLAADIGVIQHSYTHESAKRNPVSNSDCVTNGCANNSTLAITIGSAYGCPYKCTDHFPDATTHFDAKHDTYVIAELVAIGISECRTKRSTIASVIACSCCADIRALVSTHESAKRNPVSNSDCVTNGCANNSTLAITIGSAYGCPYKCTDHFPDATTHFDTKHDTYVIAELVAICISQHRTKRSTIASVIARSVGWPHLAADIGVIQHSYPDICALVRAHESAKRNPVSNSDCVTNGCANNSTLAITIGSAYGCPYKCTDHFPDATTHFDAKHDTYVIAELVAIGISECRTKRSTIASVIACSCCADICALVSTHESAKRNPVSNSDCVTNGCANNSTLAITIGSAYGCPYKCTDHFPDATTHFDTKHDAYVIAELVAIGISKRRTKRSTIASVVARSCSADIYALVSTFECVKRDPVSNSDCVTNGCANNSTLAITIGSAYGCPYKCTDHFPDATTHFDAKHDTYVIAELVAIGISECRTKRSTIASVIACSVGWPHLAADIGAIQHSYTHESAKRNPVSNSDCVTNGCANNSTLAITIGSAYGCPYKCTDHFPDATTHFDAKHDTYVIAELDPVGISERRTKRSTIASVVARSCSADIYALVSTFECVKRDPVSNSDCVTNGCANNSTLAITIGSAYGCPYKCTDHFPDATTHFDAKHDTYVIAELVAIGISECRTKRSTIASVIACSCCADIRALVSTHESAKRNPVSNSDCVTNGCANNSTLAITIGSAYACPYKCTDHFPDATTHFDTKHDAYVIAELVAIGISKRRTKRSTIASAIACSVGWPHLAADIGAIQHSYTHESAKRNPVSNSDCVTNGCANNSTLAITIGSAYSCPYKCTDHIPDATTHFDAKHDTYVINELVAIGISERRTKRNTIASVIACSVGWPHLAADIGVIQHSYTHESAKRNPVSNSDCVTNGCANNSTLAITIGSAYSCPYLSAPTIFPTATTHFDAKHDTYVINELVAIGISECRTKRSTIASAIACSVGWPHLAADIGAIQHS